MQNLWRPGFLYSDVIGYGIWAGFQSILQSLCPRPQPARCLLITHVGCTKGETGWGREKTWALLPSDNKTPSKLWNQIKYTSCLCSNFCSLELQWQLIDSHWKPSFHSDILLKVKMHVLWIRKAWSWIFIKAYLHGSGRSRGQRTPEELPWPSRGVDRKGWDVDCKEERGLSCAQPSVRETMLSLEV